VTSKAALDSAPDSRAPSNAVSSSNEPRPYIDETGAAFHFFAIRAALMRCAVSWVSGAANNDVIGLGQDFVELVEGRIFSA